jgi:zinc protease
MAGLLRHFARLHALILGLGLATSAFAAEERVADRVFLVRDQPGTPTQFQMLVNAGCLDEAGGQCRGLAHYLEHLVLVGRNVEHKDAAVRFFPDGSANGWTNLRATAFVHTVPARAEGPRADLETLFGFYAARLTDFAITAEDAARERNVVRQEHDWRVGSRPFPRFARKLDRLLIPDHPSGQWTIGTPETIDGFTVEEAQAFHHNWYALNNVWFVVKGDIDAATLKDIASKALAGLTPRTLPARTVLRAPQVVVERKDVREEDPAVRRAGVYYKKLMHMEEPNFDTIRAARAVTLTFLRSRLPGSPYDVIVDREKLAAGAISVTMDRVAPRTVAITLGADVSLDGTPEELLRALERYVDQLEAKGIPAETIARLQSRFADAQVNADKNPGQVYARLINWLASRAPYDELARWPQRLGAARPADVEVVLKGLSSPGRVVTGILEPAKLEAKQ